MDHTTTYNDRLRAQAAQVFALAKAAKRNTEARNAEIDALIHDAAAREHRRAAFNARDASCYRLGAAFEPAGALDLDPVAMSGWLDLDAVGLLLLVQVGLAMPEASVAEQLRALFRSAAGREIRAWGVWIRWQWLKALYLQEVEAFLASPSGRDPKAPWRPKPPKAKQTYIAAEIGLLLEITPPTFATREAAFDWIRSHDGNPRFTTEPARPDLTTLTDLLA